MEKVEKVEKMEKKPDSFMAKLRAVAPFDFVYTVILLLNYFAYGISVNIFGPSVVDLSKLYSVSLKAASNLLTANIFGFLIGTLSGMLYRWFNRQLIFSLSIILLAVSNGLLPFYGRIEVAFVGYAVSGLGMGVLRSTANMFLIDLWPTGTTVILQVGQFLYSLGVITAPVLMSRYVKGTKNTTDSGEEYTVEMRRANLAVPFAISAFLQLLPGIFLLVLFFVHRYRPSNATANLPRKSIDFNHRNSVFELPAAALSKLQSSAISWRKSKLAVGCLLYAVYFTAETGYFPFATSMLQYLPIRMSAAEAATVMTVMSAAYAVGPLVTAFVSLKLRVEIILSYHFALLLLGVGILLFGQNDRGALYAGSAVLGLGYSACIPSINAFINEHFKLTNSVSAVYSFASGIAAMATPLIISPFLQDHPAILIFLTGSLVLISLGLFTVLRLWLIFFK